MKDSSQKSLSLKDKDRLATHVNRNDDQVAFKSYGTPSSDMGGLPPQKGQLLEEHCQFKKKQGAAAEVAGLNPVSL